MDCELSLTRGKPLEGADTQRFGEAVTVVVMGTVESDSEFDFVEVVEIPSGGSPEAAHEDFLGRHPEFIEKPDWLRVDRVCGRDGFSALRFWVRKSAPPEPRRPQLP